ncbi:uncharacterized protein (TIGR03086 family) [Pseudarthrobacter defluvii]|uniref:TIGR03086 family metal-binding protein n=1 Tax=Pseudarthrobacter defluvii TaxID=410837 RepID=UPI00278BA7A9|nr:TIGR03086 family metal-binding protein [Pseudarthrobacter defluvii]MDQ0769414.1 uncharacterized protein (TIGR03086 family) [Pseudarthrobacter defluvii]
MEALQGRIEKAHTATEIIFKGIRHDQWALPTPCTDWDVRTLANHMVGGYRLFHAAITGTGDGMDFEADWLGTDPVTEYTNAATDVLTAWRAPDVLERTLTISVGPVPGQIAALIHLTEVIVHGIDLAVATSQEQLIDDGSAEDLLTTMHQMGIMGQFRVQGIFQPELPAPSDAPAHRRLMAFLGRDANWQPAARAWAYRPAVQILKRR